MPGKENGKRRGVIRLNAGRYDPIKSALGWGKQEKGKVKRGKAGKREKGKGKRTEDTEDAEDEEKYNSVME